MTKAEAVEMLTASVKNEVEYRHRQFVMNDSVKAQVETMAEWLTSDSTK
jgi:hypothetical protein